MASPFRIGRVISLMTVDSPFTSLYDVKEFVDLEMVVVYCPASTSALLTLFAHATTQDDTTNIGQFAVSAAASSAESEQFSFAWGDAMPPLSFKGLSATLTGTGARAWIYVV